MMKIIYAATKNKHKLSEIRQILEGFEVRELESLPDIAETGATFEENAVIKAEFLSKLVKHPVIADDSGIEADALNKAPGVFSARYAGEHGDDKANIKKLLAELKDKSDRTCRFVCVIALAEGGRAIKTFRGEVEGTVAFEESGENGFGYDPIFLLKNGKTMAQLKSEEKNEISHRKNALTKLRDYLKG